jgi:DNA-3-methyladenine glycosylase I
VREASLSEHQAIVVVVGQSHLLKSLKSSHALVKLMVLAEKQTAQTHHQKHERPLTDDEYFAEMSRILFQAGLNWTVVDKKWETTKRAFDNFNTDKVAQYTKSDVKRLLKDEGIVRNRDKVEAIIQNAKEFQQIRKQCGSFKRYMTDWINPRTTNTP